MDRPELIVLALCAAPVSLVAIVALVRGYELNLTMRRRRQRKEDR